MLINRSTERGRFQAIARTAHSIARFSGKQTGLARLKARLIDPRHFKRPESVLVVVHTANEALLLKRADQADFWQSVTGSLNWGESANSAAQRELREETGIEGITLRSTGIRRSFAIVEAWKPAYHPADLRNYESLFYCSLTDRVPIELNPEEHDEYLWLPIDQAINQVTSWTNALALKSLKYVKP